MKNVKLLLALFICAVLFGVFSSCEVPNDSEEPIDDGLPVGTFDYGDPAGYSISGRTVDEAGNPVSGVKLTLHITGYDSESGFPGLRSDSNGAYSFTGLPDFTQFDQYEIGIVSEEDPYERQLKWPLWTGVSSADGTEINGFDILAEEITPGTVLTGTITNVNGIPLQPTDINMVSVSRSESSQGPVLPNPNNTYDSATGTYTFNNCLAGSADPYVVHVSIPFGSLYDNEGVTLTTTIMGGTTNTLNVIVPFAPN